MNYIEEQNEGKLQEWAKVDYVVNPLEGAIRRLHSGLRSSAIEEEVIPFGHDAFIIELDVTSNATQVVCFKNPRDVNKIEGGMPLIVGLKRDGEKSLVPDGDFMLMPNDRIAVATTGLSSFNRILNIFGHEATDFPAEPRVAVLGANKIGQRIADDWLQSGSRYSH